MYQTILEEVKVIGDSIHQFSGKCADIGQTKQRLTEHDVQTERRLCEFIKTIDLNACFFAEEEHEMNEGHDNSLWIIDPISNTFNFIHGLPHYSICVAHMLDGQIVFAAVYDPCMKELFYAKKGKGAFLNGERICVSVRDQDLAIIVGPHLVPGNTRLQEVVGLFDVYSKVGTVRSIGSLGIHYAYVACGRAEGAISLPKDIFPEMAGKLLVEEAGGRFTDFAGQEVNLETRDVVASNGIVHSLLLGKVSLLMTKK